MHGRGDWRNGTVIAAFQLAGLEMSTLPAVQELRKGAKAAEEATPALREVIEQAVKESEQIPEALAGFGKKGEREAARQKQIQKEVEKLNAQAAGTAGESVEETVKRAGGQRASGAIAHAQLQPTPGQQEEDKHGQRVKVHLVAKQAAGVKGRG